MDVDLDRLAEQVDQAAMEVIPAVVRRHGRVVDASVAEARLKAKIEQGIAAALREHFGQAPVASQEEKYRTALEQIKFGGEWLAKLEREQDPAVPGMPLAYSRDCFRIAKAALEG